MLDRRLIQNFDWVLLLLLLLLAGVSILNLYSATYAIRDVGGSRIVMKQFYWFLIGFSVLLFMITFNYYYLERLAYPAYFFTVALLIIVLLVGKAMSGSQRWLSLGPLVFQPSELAKISMVLVLAKFFSDRDSPEEYRINQSKIAIGSGQFWGKGYLQGTQTRLHFLPEQHTDFAFSVLAEEWGLVGVTALLLLYLFLILWGLNIAKGSKDRFGAILAVGIVAIVFWQVVINVGMVTGLLPVVGIPLLLFSYGGSSLISTMAAMGLLMNISMRRFMFQ
ncbi:MAG: rod shape-determining protein RodA [Desulfobacteraceae bacterium 4572_87]|nr:MAG: rod shape-determining protein RodA [Desulfobacteraceae bacterium 4572_87]